MKISFKVQFNKAGKYLKAIPKTLAQKSFLTILLLFFISLALGVFVYYKYVFLVKSGEPQAVEKLFQLNEQAYQGVLTEWQEKEAKFRAADLKEYPNLFVPAATSATP